MGITTSIRKTLGSLCCANERVLPLVPSTLGLLISQRCASMRSYEPPAKVATLPSRPPICFASLRKKGRDALVDEEFVRPGRHVFRVWFVA